MEWSETFARAGFLTVSIAHSPRTDDERAAICEHYGITTFDECVAFKCLHHDRAYDVRRVLDWIDDAAAGAFAGEIDTDRILHAGHSAGSGGGAMVAGASRDFNGMTRTAPDPRARVHRVLDRGSPRRRLHRRVVRDRGPAAPERHRRRRHDERVGPRAAAPRLRADAGG